MLLTPATSVWKAVAKPLASVFWANISNACWSLEWERLILFCSVLSRTDLQRNKNYFWLANFSLLATVHGLNTLQGFSFILCMYFRGFFHTFLYFKMNLAFVGRMFGNATCIFFFPLSNCISFPTVLQIPSRTKLKVPYYDFVWSTAN